MGDARHVNAAMRSLGFIALVADVPGYIDLMWRVFRSLAEHFRELIMNDSFRKISTI